MTREQLLREWDEWYDVRPHWLNSLNKGGILWHINRARAAAGVPEAELPDDIDEA